MMHRIGAAGIARRIGAAGRRLAVRGLAAARSRLAVRCLAAAFAGGAAASAWLWGTPSGEKLRWLAADTLITTQHREWAKYVVGERALRERLSAYERAFDRMAEEPQRTIARRSAADGESRPTGLYRIEDIAGPGWTGKLLVVPDPTRIRIGVPGAAGRGEKVSGMMMRLGAAAGVNGGGFSDPNWSGNGFRPTGVVISGGERFYSDAKAGEAIDVVGFTAEGALIAGQYTLEEIERLGVREAVSFRPRLIVNGKGLVQSDEDGWGLAPRTAVAQTEDGTVLFAVIDGRQAHSVGATLYDVQQLFLDKGAVVAANLDGGASTVLTVREEKNGFDIVNKPATTAGERLVPTAFLVFERPEAAHVRNVWEGLDMKAFDPAK